MNVEKLSKVVSDTLDELESDGIIERTRFLQDHALFPYRLVDSGGSAEVELRLRDALLAAMEG